MCNYLKFKTHYTARKINELKQYRFFKSILCLLVFEKRIQIRKKIADECCIQYYKCPFYSYMYLYTSNLIVCLFLHQGSQTCGPRLSFKKTKLEFWTNKGWNMFKLWYIFPHCGPQSTSCFNLRPAETLFLQIWHVNRYEFETPGLHRAQSTV